MNERVRIRIGRMLSPAALIVLRFYSRLTGQRRARSIVRSHEGEVLLVMETIGHGRWSLPGGGIRRGEEPVQAAARELYEETGIKLSAKQFEWLADLAPDQTGGYWAHIYTVTIDKAELPKRPYNRVEIVRLAWFDEKKLPDDLSPVAGASLAKLR